MRPSPPRRGDRKGPRGYTAAMRSRQTTGQHTLPSLVPVTGAVPPPGHRPPEDHLPELQQALLAWFDANARPLPWRRHYTPYEVWISEIMLQQTQMERGVSYFLRWMERFPDLHALAAASEEDVLHAWEGLGYYSRARNLLAAARLVMQEHGGVFPSDPEAIRALPGIGDYTAAAVCSAAYDAPCAVLDGNVFRVLARLFDIDLPIDSTAGKRTFAELAQMRLDKRCPGRYNQAVMDFGALQCTPAQPGCADCPLASRCLALAAGTVAERPVKQAKTKVRDRWFNYLHVTCGDRTLLRRRGEGDIWQGLYEFPMIETDRAADFSELTDSEEFRTVLGGVEWRLLRSVAMPKHQLSHQTLHAVFHRFEIFSPVDFPSVPTATLGDYAVPRLIDRYLDRQP